MRFYGNEVCCASYACLNAMEDPQIELPLFEVATSVPFGVSHLSNRNFDRLLTTYCDPNKGIEKAVALWGYEVLKYEAETPEEVVSILKAGLKESRAVLGPIDMGKIGYQIVPALLMRMDHYIMLEEWTAAEIICWDSEGICGYKMNYETLVSYLSVNGIPEAKGRIAIRFFLKTGSCAFREEILIAAGKHAVENLRNAEQERQGSFAITECGSFLGEERNQSYKWRLPLLYDLQYLIQRKWLLKYLKGECGKNQKTKGLICNETEDIIEKQLSLLGDIYCRLKRKSQIDKNQFYKLGKLEKELSESLDYGFSAWKEVR